MADRLKNPLSKEDLLDRALHAAASGIAIADATQAHMPMIYANRAFEAMTGYTLEELRNTGLRQLQGDQPDQTGHDVIREALRSGQEATALLHNFRKDGSAYWVELFISPVRGDDGRITHFIGVQNDVTQRLASERKLSHRATHDELTGLPNRQLFIDRLTQTLRQIQRYKRDAVVMFIDLDNFKLVNDSLGHAAGDVLLTTISKRLSDCIRATDTVARFGGDEFVILLTGDGETLVDPVLARIDETMKRAIELQGSQHYPTLSIGYARAPEHGDEAEQLLQRADLAMYQAKARGRNCAVAFEPAFDRGRSERLFVISRLREAEQQQQFALYFQPQYRWDGTPCGVETLLRWRHPERGVLAPAHFLDALDEGGMMNSIGRWGLREAISHHQRLRDAGFAQLRIAVNLSAAQMRAGVLRDVSLLIDEFDLPHGVLEIELTESVLMSHAEHTIAMMRELAHRGVSFAVDDFGTGYSSLSYLKRLPIQRLKIDRSFVQGVGHDPDDEAICTAIISLASTLGFDTVAEGVETDQQRQWLIKHGCGELQGFLFARPMPFSELIIELATTSVG